jgi:hypothetical protein
MRIATMLALVGVIGMASSLTADDKKPAGEEWPAYRDGKYVHKTITFTPAKVQYLPTGGRRAVTRVVFRIQDGSIPADYFPVGVFGNEPDVEKAVAKYLKERDGKITVDAYWVNLPVLKKEWTGDPSQWVEGRAMLGKLVPPIDGQPGFGGGK